MKCYKNYINEIKFTQTLLKKIEINSKNHYLFFNKNDYQNYIYSLLSLKTYSPSELNYSRKIELKLNNNDYFFNTSDIHIEVDFDLLGVNECNIFLELFNHVKENLLQQKEHIFILCIHFEKIKKELMKIFYSFMNENKIKFIFLTNQVSFLDDNILKQVIIKRIDYNDKNVLYKNEDYKEKVDQLIEIILNGKTTILNIREKVYQLLIRNYDIYECLNYLINQLIIHEIINPDNVNLIFNNFIHIMEKYNNNYRSIFHLEYLIIYLMNLKNH